MNNSLSQWKVCLISNHGTTKVNARTFWQFRHQFLLCNFLLVIWGRERIPSELGGITRNQGNFYIRTNFTNFRIQIFTSSALKGILEDPQFDLHEED